MIWKKPCMTGSGRDLNLSCSNNKKIGKMKKIKLGDFLVRSKIPVIIKDNKQYKRVTIKTKHQGVSVRDFEIGSKIVA